MSLQVPFFVVRGGGQSRQVQAPSWGPAGKKGVRSQSRSESSPGNEGPLSPTALAFIERNHKEAMDSSSSSTTRCSVFCMCEPALLRQCPACAFFGYLPASL